MSNSKENYIYASIDIETTGFDFELDEIIEIGILPLNDNFTINTQIKPFHARIKATQILERHKKALEINGLDPTVGDQLIHALDKLEDWMIENKIAKIIPVGQNIDKFDLDFLDATFEGYIDYSDIFHYHSYDLVKHARNISLAYNIKGMQDPFKNGHSLKSLCEAIGIEYPKDSHTAIVDCITTAKVFKQLLETIT